MCGPELIVWPPTFNVRDRGRRCVIVISKTEFDVIGVRLRASAAAVPTKRECALGERSSLAVRANLGWIGSSLVITAISTEGTRSRLHLGPFFQKQQGLTFIATQFRSSCAMTFSPVGR